MSRPRPLIAHVLFRLDYGGLENGVVNLVNRLPAAEFDHAIISLTEVSSFRERIVRPDVTVHALNKRAGKDPAAYLRLYRLLRRLQPSILHTRNVGTLDCAAVAALAGVRHRIHGEHGWDVHDPDGTNRRYLTVRRALNPMVDRFVALSVDLERWLIDRVGIRASKVTRICNGVDLERFAEAQATAPAILPPEIFPAEALVVGSVTRFNEIKDPLNLVRAFIAVRRELADAGPDVRLCMAGDGPLLAAARGALLEAGMDRFAWLPGSRDDVPALMRAMHVFALGSQREGISNTVLEAMASGLPVVASATGGNLELILPGTTGTLVPPGDSAALAAALLQYCRNPELRRLHGQAARARAEREYSLERMLQDYRSLYATACLQDREAA